MRFRFGGGHGPHSFDIPAGIFAMGMGPRGWHGHDWSDWGRGRSGRRSRRMFDSGELRLVLLKLIADQPRHGYDLIRAIEEMTGGAYAPSPGIVYPTLTMLEDMGLIEEQAAEGSRKAFAATAEGKAHLAERQEEVDALIARLTGLGEEKKKAGGAPIGRAVRNLLTAVFSRATRDGWEEDTLHEIAAILDEAAQRIERLK
jgi:DNA-binding PadR family transcriptional regulator